MKVWQPLPLKILVVAGNHSQFQTYCNMACLSKGCAIEASSPEKVRGYSRRAVEDHTVDVAYFGTFEDRADWTELRANLRAQGFRLPGEKYHG